MHEKNPVGFDIMNVIERATAVLNFFDDIHRFERSVTVKMKKIILIALFFFIPSISFGNKKVR